MGAFVAPIVGGVTSVIGGLLGSRAAKKAAEIQERFGKLGAENIARTGQTISDRQAKMYERATDRYKSYDPYTQAGDIGVRTLADLLGIGGTQGADTGSMTTDIPLNLPPALQGKGLEGLKGLDLSGFKFDPSQAAVDPSMKFRLEEGQKAIERSAAAKGNLLGGGTAKALEQYSQGLASEEYQNMFNRGLTEYGTDVNAKTKNWDTALQAALTGWQTGNTANLQNWETGTQNALNAFNAANTNRQNLYNRLMGVTGLGANMTTDQARSQAGLDIGFGQNAGATDWATAMAENDAWSQVANAQAGGAVGGTNAWLNALKGISGSVTGGLNMRSLSQLLGMQGGGGYPFGGTDIPYGGDVSNIPGGLPFGTFGV